MFHFISFHFISFHFISFLFAASMREQPFMTNCRGSMGGQLDSGVSTTTTKGCKGSSLLWYRLPENAHTTTASTLSLREEGVFKDSGTYRIVFESYFHSKYARISFYPLCCVDRLLLYGEHVSKMAGRCHQRGPIRCCSRFHQHTAGSTACHREEVDKEPLRIGRRCGIRPNDNSISVSSFSLLFFCSWQEMLN